MDQPLVYIIENGIQEEETWMFVNSRGNCATNQRNHPIPITVENHRSGREMFPAACWTLDEPRSFMDIRGQNSMMLSGAESLSESNSSVGAAVGPIRNGKIKKNLESSPQPSKQNIAPSRLVVEPTCDPIFRERERTGRSTNTRKEKDHKVKPY